MVSKQKTLKIFTERFLCLLLALLVSLPLFTTLTASAATSGTIVDADYTDGTYSKSSDSKWYATYCPTAGYKGQGVLLYLLERDGGGAVAGTTPKAFPCSREVMGYELHARDKYNRYPEVTHWEGTYVPWEAGGTVANNGGFLKNSSTYNTAAIKSWLKTPTSTVGGSASTKGIDMVERIWGSDIARRFTNEELILVAEPIIAVQFAQKAKSTILDIDDSMSLEMIKRKLRIFKSVVEGTRITKLSTDLEQFLDERISWLETVITSSSSIPPNVASATKRGIIEALSQINRNTYMYYPLGDVYAGTSKMLAKRFTELDPVQSVTGAGAGPSSVWEPSDQGRVYYRKAANAASYISTGSVVCANAGFTLWDKGSSSIRQYHPDSNLETYSIGMLAMLAFTEDGEGDYTHTYDTSCGSTPGKAPEYIPTPTTSSLSRSYTIIKAYRTLNTSTSSASTYINDGIYMREDTIGKILIEDEPTYTVVDWFTTSTPTATVGLSDATRWNESKSHASIMEQGNSSLASPITLPSAQKYLYVLLECTHTSSPPTDANYTLLE